MEKVNTLIGQMLNSKTAMKKGVIFEMDHLIW